MNEEKQTIDYAEKFLEECPNVRNTMKKFDILYKISKCDWISWIFYIVLISVFSTIKISDNYALITLGLFVISIPHVAVCVMKYVYNNLKTYIYATNCAEWLKANEFDVTDYIIERYKDSMKECDFTGITNDLFDFAAGRLYALNPNEKNNVKKHLIIRSAVGGFCLLWLAIATPIILPAVIIHNNLYLLAAILIPFVISLSIFIILYFAFNRHDDIRVSEIYRHVEIDFEN